MADRPVFHAALGRFFTALREERGWTQRQASTIAQRKRLDGMGRQTIWRLETGKVKNPEPEVLRSVATLYERPFPEVLARFIEARYGVSIDPEAVTEALTAPRLPVGLTIAPGTPEADLVTLFRALPDDSQRAHALDILRHVAALGRCTPFPGKRRAATT